MNRRLTGIGHHTKGSVLLKLFKQWTLPIAMITGVAVYFIYTNIHCLDCTHQMMNDVVSVVQPFLIFCMLFLSFCKVNPNDLCPHLWQLKLLAVQIVGFMICAIPILLFPEMKGRILLESAMICLICPTATAAVVVVNRLKGNVSYTISYTCLINLVVAIVFPAVISLIYKGNANAEFLTSFILILGHVFPVLILPLIFAMIVRYLFPKLLIKLQRNADKAFYLWCISLALCMAVTTKAIVHGHESLITFVFIGLVSALCCIFQFKIGHFIGKHHNAQISGGQSLGQKNTAFAIWLAYTFMNPVSAIAGGFYVIWHNSYNSYQLYKANNDLSA